MKTIKFLVSLLLLVLVITTCSEEQIDGVRIGTINGKVVSSGTNSPLQNVKISTNPVTSTVFSDEEGYFFINNALVETYAVQAELDGFVTAFESVTVLENTAAVVSFELITSNANNQSPAIPILVFPEDLVTEADLEVEFTWESSDPDANDELSYTLELRNGSTNEIELFETEQDTFYLASNLQLSTTYFWQVKVSDDTNEEVSSSISQFTTITAPNNSFVFVKEENGNSVVYSGDEGVSDSGDDEVDVSLLKLTSETNNSFRPRTNAITNKIAYLRTAEGGNTQIFTMNTDGSNKTQVTNTIPVAGFRFDHVDFCWAQNGSKLYYPYFDKLYDINPDGSGGGVPLFATTDGSFISEVESVVFDNDLVILKTNTVDGYNARIFTVRLSTETEETVIVEGLPGALGGIDITANGNQVVYTRDLSGSQNPNYRQFQSRVFIYDINASTNTQVDTDVLIGENDLDVKFAPNEGGFIFTRSSSSIDGIPRILKYQFGTSTQEVELFTAASMPDWD
ncbi:carboxypeptidase regulatory-like domain-containing protein [Lacinutrix mariniflava]|uniref:carboxypeptidase regulatory-like domain-containing protein n=1 Tax=Lacinutrix mariniflava TaxID=342955 RepID=UPI0006E1E6A7|nr:carboxypeptidase regulatory-like domain-containing protein [Lacinutrix mariniflava]